MINLSARLTIQPQEIIHAIPTYSVFHHALNIIISLSLKEIQGHTLGQTSEQTTVRGDLLEVVEFSIEEIQMYAILVMLIVINVIKCLRPIAWYALKVITCGGKEINIVSHIVLMEHMGNLGLASSFIKILLSISMQPIPGNIVIVSIVILSV